jgi:hypothetical protein
MDSIIRKLSRTSYIIRKSKQCFSIDAPKIVYYDSSHSVMSYGLILVGNRSHSLSVFKLQKRAIWIVVGDGNRDSCREIFKSLKILTLISQFTYPLVMFVVNKMELLVENSEMYTTKIRNSSNLHLPSSNLTVFQKGPLYFRIRSIMIFQTIQNSDLRAKINLRKHYHCSSIYIHFMIWMNFLNL